jgi:N utilization substance protein A
MNNELIRAINQISAEKELSKQVILEAIEAALVSAYRRNFGSANNVTARIDPDTGEMHVLAEKTVVEKVTDPKTEIALQEARRVDPTAEVGGIVVVDSTPADFGRIAAQTAKQVILQRIKEAERETVYQYFEERAGEIVQGKVQSVDYATGTVTVNLDRAEGVMTKEDQIPTERYRPGSNVRALLVEVHRGNRGPQIRLSRSHRNLLRRLLEKEVPEIFQGIVELKAIAREPGQRSKVAVAATQPGVDPVGSCVGMRGTRIQAIVNDLGGEKIDIVEWSPDTATFIANALSPAKVTDVFLEETSEGRTAIVIVPDRQLSLAIGKEGQNARLVAKLTGWRIDIKSETEAAAEGLDRLAVERRRLADSVRTGAEADLLEVAEKILRQSGSGQQELLRAQAFDAALDAVLSQGVTRPTTAEEELAAEAAELEIAESPVEAAAEPVVAEEAPPAEAEPAPAEPLAAADVEVEAPAEVPAPSPGPAVAGPAGEVLLPEGFEVAGEVEEEDYEGEEERRRREKKSKKRQLVFDEDAGQVVAIRRRKPSRSGWSEEDYDF